VLAMDLLNLPAPLNGSNVLLSRTLRRSPPTHKQQHDYDSARLTFTFPWRKEKSKWATAFHRVRDIDRPTPLSGGGYKYAIREKTPSKAVDTKGLGRAGFSEDSF